jgi:hypothetical protein
MNITITGARYAPRWDTLQVLIREMMADPSATIVRISRLDGGCDYRALGRYALGVRTGDVVSSGTLEVLG